MDAKDRATQGAVAEVEGVSPSKEKHLALTQKFNNQFKRKPQ